MQLILHPFDLPLRHPFTTSIDTHVVQHTLVVELRDGAHSGFGEATSNEYYGVTIESLCAVLESARGQIESYTLAEPVHFWQAMQSLLAEHPFAQCALDEAAHDLWGKRLGQPVYKLWGLSIDQLPPSDYTIGIDTIDRMVAKLAEFPGWPIYKIKLGTDDDVEIVHELRKHTDATFRVDANTGWTAETTIANARALRPLGVEFIEQPLPADDWDGMQRVFAESVVPVIADESCIVESDVARCEGYFHGVNIKLTKCGGLTPARRMIGKARQLGLQVMVGCMLESTVGISAIAQLLPLLDYVDMDGAVLISRDVASGVRVERGLVIYPAEAGCGVKLLAPSDSQVG